MENKFNLIKTKIQNISQNIGRKKSISMYYEIDNIILLLYFIVIVK